VNTDDRTRWLNPSPPIAVDGEDSGAENDARDGERDPEREREGGSEGDG